MRGSCRFPSSPQQARTAMQRRRLLLVQQEFLVYLFACSEMVTRHALLGIPGSNSSEITSPPRLWTRRAEYTFGPQTRTETMLRLAHLLPSPELRLAVFSRHVGASSLRFAHTRAAGLVRTSLPNASCSTRSVLFRSGMSTQACSTRLALTKLAAAPLRDVIGPCGLPPPNPPVVTPTAKLPSPMVSSPAEPPGSIIGSLLNALGGLTKTLFSIATYGYFFWVFLAFHAFQLNALAIFPNLAAYFPYAIDVANGMAAGNAMFNNLALIGVFGLSHTAFARKTFKQIFGFLGDAYRSVYVLMSALAMHAQMHAWVPMNTAYLWAASPMSGAWYLLMAGFAAGILVLLTSTFALDHFALFGLSQCMGVDLNEAIGLAPKAPSESDTTLVKRAHYKLMRHPIMTGFLITFFCVPTMSAGHALFSLAYTSYILIAVYGFEEPDLVEEHGEQYKAYKQEVAAFLPGVF